MRNSGMFIDLHDASGKIQIFSHKDYLRAEDQPLLKLLDIGDLIGVEGLVRGTPRGELTVYAEPLRCRPRRCAIAREIYELADIELRYCQRYLDLIMNLETRETLRRRSRIVARCAALCSSTSISKSRRRRCTPPGRRTAKPFVTHHNALDIDLDLRIARNCI